MHTCCEIFETFHSKLTFFRFYKKSNTQDPKRIIKKDVKWDQLPSISATSSATSSKQIPKYRAYEGMTQDGSLQIIITMEVPLLVSFSFANDNS